MSLRINMNHFDEKKTSELLDELTYKDEETGKEVYGVIIDEENICLPHNFGFNNGLKIPLKECFTNTKFTFNGELKPEQKEAREDVVKYLNKQGSTILSCGVGFGKTITAINIASKIKMRTLVVVNRLLLLDQWKESVEKFTNNCHCYIINPSKKLKEDGDIYVVNVQNISKLNKDFLNTFGYVIVDELHLIITENGIKNLLHLKPKYLLGLSATPYRNDYMGKGIQHFFGDKTVHKKLNKKHLVYKVNTKFTPEVDFQFNGKINWNSVLNSQAYDTQRNEKIIKIIKHFPEKHFLILVKRIDQGKYLLNRLEKEGIVADSLLGKQKYKQTDNKVLVGTTSKCGTGFDAPKLDSLILAADIEAYFIQQLGRCFRRADNNPVIFDLVDDNNVLRATLLFKT